MKYSKIIQGTFIDRPNRFIAHVQIENKIETVHVKNTGRCKELLIPGCKVILEDFRNTEYMKNRKTFFDLIAVYKKLDKKHPLYKNSPELLINMDSQAPNKVAKEWLENLSAEEAYDYIKPEYKYGNSRVDFYMEKHKKSSSNQNNSKTQQYLMEVKGCTLEIDGTGYFPDAPSERGVKHLKELIKASSEGILCTICFVIQIPGVKKVLPNIQTHKEFGTALEEAKNAGVQVLFLQCDVAENELKVSSHNLQV